jgi:DNA-binding transcriptional regulator YiaG
MDIKKLTRSEAAALLDVSTKTLTAWTQRCRDPLPFHNQPGRHARVV